LGHFPTQPAANPSTKQGKQAKINLFKNFGASLLLLHSFPKIQLESASIQPKTLAISLIADILFYGKYTI
jgi:hypothetical protein